MRCRVRSLKATALVNRDIHHHRTRLHGLNHVPGDKLRGGGPWNKHCTDKEIAALTICRIERRVEKMVRT